MTIFNFRVTLANVLLVSCFFSSSLSSATSTDRAQFVLTADSNGPRGVFSYSDPFSSDLLTLRINVVSASSADFLLAMKMRPLIEINANCEDIPYVYVENPMGSKFLQFGGPEAHSDCLIDMINRIRRSVPAVKAPIYVEWLPEDNPVPALRINILVDIKCSQETIQLPTENGEAVHLLL